MRFESMISDISARFVNIPPDEVGPSIEVVFSEILDLLQVDRIGLIRHGKDSDSFKVIHAAYRNQIPRSRWVLICPLRCSPISTKRFL